MNENQKYLSSDNKEKFEKSIVQPAAKWAELNKAKVFIWYDSKVTKNQSIINSKECFKIYVKNKIKNVEFKDVRKILNDFKFINKEITNQNELKKISETFNKYKKLAFNERSPLFFRVDLIRAQIIQHAIENKTSDYVVVSDLDATPIDKNEIFDKTTLDHLNNPKKSYVFAMGKTKVGFENGFQIVSTKGKDRAFFQAHRALIQWNIKFMGYKIKKGHDKSPRFDKDYEQKVFDSYSSMLIYMEYLLGHYGEKMDNEKWLHWVKNQENNSTNNEEKKCDQINDNLIDSDSDSGSDSGWYKPENRVIEKKWHQYKINWKKKNKTPTTIDFFNPHCGPLGICPCGVDVIGKNGEILALSPSKLAAKKFVPLPDSHFSY